MVGFHSGFGRNSASFRDIFSLILAGFLDEFLVSEINKIHNSGSIEPCGNVRKIIIWPLTFITPAPPVGWDPKDRCAVQLLVVKAEGKSHITNLPTNKRAVLFRTTAVTDTIKKMLNGSLVVNFLYRRNKVVLKHTWYANVFYWPIVLHLSQMDFWRNPHLLMVHSFTSVQTRIVYRTKFNKIEWSCAWKSDQNCTQNSASEWWGGGLGWCEWGV